MLALCQTALWIYPLHWQKLGISPAYFGWIMALFNVTAGLSGLLAGHLDKRLGLKSASVMFVLALFFSYLLAGQIVAIGAFTFALLQQFVRGSATVYYSDQLNRLVDSGRRATVASIRGMTLRLVYMLSLVVIGALMERFGVIFCQNLMAVAVLVVCGTGLITIMRPEG